MTTMENNPTKNLRKRYLREDGENPSKVTKLELTNDIETPKNQLKLSEPDLKEIFKNEKIDDISELKQNLSIMLECPVCMDLPRTGPIYGCRNGHHTCQKCSKPLQNCPVCRDPDIKCRQLMVENVLKTILKDTKIKCKHQHCQVEGMLEHITEHEYLCVAREINCPMSFRGNCQFRGHLRDFLRHIRDKKCCQMLLFPEWKREAMDEPFEKCSVFQSHVGDNKTGSSILDTNNNMETLWKPTLLLSKKILTAGMACIFIARKSDGTWSLLIQVLVAKEVIKYWTVTIEVSDFKNPDAPVFTFKGKPISQELSPKEAFETGHIMILKDNQIKPFVKSDTNHLFDYKIRFDLNSQFEEKCLDIVNGKFPEVSEPETDDHEPTTPRKDTFKNLNSKK